MRNRFLFPLLVLTLGVGGIVADEVKTDPAANSKPAAKQGKRTRPNTGDNAGATKRPETDHHALAGRIDEEINKRLTAEKVMASPRCEDAEFVRRIYLDLTGIVPPADKAAAFIDAADSSKRSKLIDELLASPAFGRHLADVWDKLLFHRVTDNRAIKIEPLSKWLEEKFNSNVRWDALVSELLTATGSQDDNGAATYFLGALTADKMVDSVSRVFMGVKLECAQCHNHPFTGWKQNDYWGMAAFFMKVRVQGNAKSLKKGDTPDVVESERGRQKNLPESAQHLPPKFFQGEQPTIRESEPLRPVLAKWLASPSNRFFSRAFANRVWGQLFGSGIVNPIDDMHDDRVPSHPELLSELAKQFTASGFDVKFLYRAICNSDAYQRTSKPTSGNDSDTELFSHMNIKAFTPEQLFDSLVAVLGEPDVVRGGGKKAGNGKGRPMTPREQFAAFFGVDEDGKATEYEEGIPQALRLMNNPFTARNSAPVARRLTQGLSQEKALDKLYLTALARRPTPEETAKLTAYVGKADSANSAYGDILWALLNSSEFTLNH